LGRRLVWPRANEARGAAAAGAADSGRLGARRLAIAVTVAFAVAHRVAVAVVIAVRERVAVAVAGARGVAVAHGDRARDCSADAHAVAVNERSNDHVAERAN